MKRMGLVTTVGVLLLVAQGAAAQAQQGPASWLSGNVAITNDYVFRGISQTLRGPAVQGGADLVAPIGLYVGAWGSSLNFGEDISTGARAHVELDLYAGIAREALGVTWQAGLINYHYPTAAEHRNYDFWEGVLSASRSVGGATAKASLMHSAGFFAGSGPATHLAGDVGIPLPSVFSLGLTLGRQGIENHVAFGTPDYIYWLTGLSAEAYGFKLTAAYVDTNLSRTDCFAGSDLCDGRALLTVSRSR